MLSFIHFVDMQHMETKQHQMFSQNHYFVRFYTDVDVLAYPHSFFLLMLINSFAF